MNVRRAVATLVLTAVSLGLSLAAAEFVLRLVTPFPITELSHRRPDPNFGYVVANDIQDIDEWGFRNRGVTLRDADVIAVGDSHTYGYNVDVTHAFPHVLGELTQRKVYAMAAGGYGIFQYLALLHATAQYPARDVILALYPANDLGSACSIIGLPSWQALARRVGIEPPQCKDNELSRTSVLQASALIGAIDYAWVRYSPPHCSAPEIRYPQGPCVSIAAARRHTRLTSLDDPDNQLAFADARAILAFADAELREHGKRLSVLMIPSRERVVFEWSKTLAAERDPRLAEPVESEIALADAFAADLTERGIPVLDAAPIVVQAFDTAVRRREPFYPSNDDGHPFASGYAAYAQAAAELLAKVDAGR